MKSKVFTFMQSPGIVRDTPAHMLNEAAWSDGSNVRFAERGVEGLAGDLATLSTGSISPLWLWAFPPIGAPKWVYANLTAAWVVEGTTHTNITRAAGAYTAVAEERWQASVFNGVGVLNNTIDVPQAWTAFDPGTLLVNLPNWDANRRCKSIRAFKNFLVALHMTDSGAVRPYRILWSDSAVPGTLPGSWNSTDPNTDSREFDLAETLDYLVDQLIMGDINVIYKENSTWGMQYIGPPFYFRFWKILSNNGLLHRDCVDSVPFGHVVVTQDDIITHSGQVENARSILDKTMRNWLFSTIDTTNFRNSFLFSHPRNKEVYFCFPAIGATYATQAVVWNWRDGSLGVRELFEIPFAAVGPVGESIIADEEWGV